MINVLIVEDSASIIDGLKDYMKDSDYNLTACMNLKSARKYLDENTPDIIILDVGLPDGNGFKFYTDDIKERNIPTIFLTARDDEDDIVKGLDIGAQDYVTKPFSAKALLARIRRIIASSGKSGIIKAHGISFDMDGMAVYKDGEKVALSSMELKLLQLLFINLNKVVTRDAILDKIWEWTGNDVDDHTVTVYFKRIREKLGTDLIETVRGLGYKVTDDEENA